MALLQIMKQWRAAVAVFLALWLFFVLFITYYVPPGLDAAARADKIFHRAVEELAKLSEENKKMEKIIGQLKQEISRHNDETSRRNSQGSLVENLSSRLKEANTEISRLANKSSEVLTYEGEHARRKAENTVTELWYFLDSELKKLDEENKPSHWSAKIAKLKKELGGYKRTMVEDFDKIRHADKAEEYRSGQSRALGQLVHRRLDQLQNPVDCNSVKKLLCNLAKDCGFGCQFHHVVHCLIMAYAMNRTLVLDSRGWSYSSYGWEAVFEPLSRTCSFAELSGTQIDWQSSLEAMSTYDIIQVPIVDWLSPRPEFLPLKVPADLAAEISIFHGNPAAWWIGQVSSYCFRLNPAARHDVLEAGETMGFHETAVGVHVRRTDKIVAEATFHSIDEYMIHVAEHFDQLETTHNNVVRRVYLATDDPNSLIEAKSRYPNYTFISDSSIARSANLDTRYSDKSLRGIITDIFYLSRCNFLVCTFSSQVCRVAYVLMQTMHGDASRYFRSLDDIFYFGGQDDHNVVVVEPHLGSSDGTLDLQTGDLVGIAGNHWDGYSLGVNRRTNISGLFPSYKAEDTMVTAKMPVELKYS